MTVNLTRKSTNFRPLDHPDTPQLLAAWRPVFYPRTTLYTTRAQIIVDVTRIVVNAQRTGESVAYHLCACEGFYAMDDQPSIMQPEVVARISSDDTTVFDVVQRAIELSRETGDLPVRIAVVRRQMFLGYVDFRASGIEDATSPAEPVLTSTQVAEALGVTSRWIRDLSAQHEVGSKVGRDWIYTLADLDQMRDWRAKHGRQRR